MKNIVIDRSEFDKLRLTRNSITVIKIRQLLKKTTSKVKTKLERNMI
jgi:hypothetical protein